MLFSRDALVRLIVPLVIEQLLAICIGMADTIMVTSVSESAVSAVSLVDSINILLIQLFSAMATGGAVVAAQYLGRRDQNNACKAAKQLMYSSVLIALVIGALAVVFCRRGCDAPDGKGGVGAAKEAALLDRDDLLALCARSS